MDSLTHIALGACIGEAAFSKKLGKKALLLGAVAQSFPDLDGLASFGLRQPGTCYSIAAFRIPFFLRQPPPLYWHF